MRVQPFLDHFTVHARHLDHEEGEHGRHDQLPHSLHPNVHDIPPVKLVEGEIGGVVEGKQPKYRRTPESKQQDAAYRRLSPFQHGKGDVVEEDQRDDDDVDFDPERLLQELSPLVNPEQVSNDSGQSAKHQ